MEYVIGIALGLTVVGGARMSGLDRQRAFYPILLILIAFYYVFFSAMSAPRSTIGAETLIAVGFLAVGVIGFKTNLWLVVAALLAHAAFDFVHPDVIHNAGVPIWWPGFCLAFDVTAGTGLGVLLARQVGPQQAQDAVMDKRLGYAVFWYVIFLALLAAKDGRGSFEWKTGAYISPDQLKWMAGLLALATFLTALKK